MKIELDPLIESNDESSQRIKTEILSDINDLRHQLITLELYRFDGGKYLHNLALAEPISFIHLENGESIDLFLDNVWGINKKRVSNLISETVPIKVQQTWASARLPEYMQIDQEFDEAYNELCDRYDSGGIPDHIFNAKLETIEYKHISLKNKYISNNRLQIFNGIRNDLSLTVELLRM